MSALEGLVAGVLVVVLALLFFEALSPSVSWDANTYHLALPKIFLAQGRLVAVPFFLYSTWPLNPEMLYALAMSLQDHVLAKALHFGCGALIAVGAFVLTRRFASTGGGLLAAALFLLEDQVQSQATTAYVDLALGLFLLLAFFLWVQANFEDGGEPAPRRDRLLLCGVFLGFFAGAKPSGALVIGIFGLLQLCLGLARRRAAGTLAFDLMLLAFPSLVLAFPWYLRSWWITGDPLHPALYPIFQGGGDEWSADLARRAFEFHRSMGMGRAPLDYLLLPLRLLGLAGGEARGSFGAHYSLIWLPLAPLILWGALRERVVRLLSVTAALYFVAWAMLSQTARLLLPALPLLCCAAGISAAAATSRLSSVGVSRWGPAALALACGFWTVWNLAVVEAGSLARLARAHARPQRELFDEQVPEHFRYINAELPEDARILFVNTNHGFFSDRAYIADSLFQASQIRELLARASSRAELRALLSRYGLTHVLVSDRQWRIQYPASFREALTTGDPLRLVHRSEGFSLYAVVDPGGRSVP
jgi:hypothetical protein